MQLSYLTHPKNALIIILKIKRKLKNRLRIITQIPKNI